jgi:hypothetical protein
MAIKTGLTFLFLTIFGGRTVMKKKLVFAVLLCFAVLSVPCARAQTGAVDVAVKVDYFHFTDSLIKSVNVDSGIFVGVEAYKQMFCPNLYLGLGAGWAGTSGSVSDVVSGSAFVPAFVTADSSIDYVPIELNLKYVIPISSCFNFALGGGGSINYFAFSSDVAGISTGRRQGQNGAAASISDSDWVWGGQFFAEFNYKFNHWFAGVDVKYQLTQDLSLFGVDTQAGADNLRAGGHIGFTF